MSAASSLKHLTKQSPLLCVRSMTGDPDIEAPEAKFTNQGSAFLPLNTPSQPDNARLPNENMCLNKQASISQQHLRAGSDKFSPFFRRLVHVRPLRLVFVLGEILVG